MNQSPAKKKDLIIDIDPAIGESFSVTDVDGVRRDIGDVGGEVKGTDFTARNHPEPRRSDAIIPPPPKLLREDEVQPSAEKLQAIRGQTENLTYFEMINKRKISFVERITNEKKPINFEHRLLHIIKSAVGRIKDGSFSNQNIKESINIEFEWEIKWHEKMFDEILAIYREIIFEMSQDDSFDGILTTDLS